MSKWDAYPDQMTVAQVAEALGKSRRWVRDLVDRGTLPAQRIGERLWVIAKDDAIAEAHRPPYSRKAKPTD
jgi:excisionase family DNA binding protein